MTPDQLRALLAAHGVSQSELARRLEVNRSTVFRWAQGKLPIQRRDQAAIRHVVECEIHD